MTNFTCVLGDWGTSKVLHIRSSAFDTSGEFLGGTPGYAGPRTFEVHNKDMFSFGRLALELFEQGLSQRSFACTVSVIYKFPVNFS